MQVKPLSADLLLYFKGCLYDWESKRKKSLFPNNNIKACDISLKKFWICGFFEVVWFMAFNTESESEKNKITVFCFFFTITSSFKV